MAATLKLLPMDLAGAEPARSWNLTDLLRRVAADEGARADEALLEAARSAVAPQAAPAPAEAPAADDVEETWTDALDLAVEATDAIRFAEERIAKLEADNRELESYLEKEVRALQARMKAADEIVQLAEAGRAAAETRAERAELRAEAAETCLSRIRDQLSPIRRARPTQAPAA